MAATYLTLYLPGSNYPVQVVEGSKLHMIYADMGASATPGLPPPARRPDPFPYYIDEDELAAALAGGGGASDASVAALIDDTGSQTRAALGAAFDAWAEEGGIGGADLSTVPTLEELERTALLGTINATATRRLGPVNFDQRIGGLTLASSTPVARSDTDYWTVQLLRLRAGQNPLIIAERSTKLTVGTAIVADQGWTLDVVQWLETARYLRKGDVLALRFTKTGTPADLADVTVSVRYEPGLLLPIRDSFARPDTTAGLGVTDTGQAWQVLEGTWGISGSAAYAPVAGTGYAVIDVGQGDFTASLTVAVRSGTFQGLAARAVDTDNMWLLDTTALWLAVNGTWTNIASHTAVISGDVLSLACVGPAVNAYLNGVLVGTDNSGTHQAATKVGIQVGGNNVNDRFDDLEVVV